MKTLFKIVGVSAVTLGISFAAPGARAQVASPPATATDADASSVSFQDFYNQLANQGTWIQSQNYGYVWQPTESDPNWRPYTYGHWVNTDAGMTWVSDESFGWATYHYGRWTNIAGTGWVWVPGYTWGPAWVSWRDSDEDVGWAPLPPDSGVGIDYADAQDSDYGDYDYGDSGFGFHIGGDCDVAYGIGAFWYNFCPIAYIGDRDCWRHFRDRRDNFGLIGRTRNVTNINFRRDGEGRFGRVHEEGPSVAALNARAHNHIEQARLTSVSRANEAGLRGNTLGVYAPRVDRTTARTARPESVSQVRAGAQVNRGTDIAHAPEVNSHVRVTGATAGQIQQARVAGSHVPVSAKVAGSNTVISRSLSRPLTSLRPEPAARTHVSSSTGAALVRPNSGTAGGFTQHEATRVPSYSSQSAARREVSAAEGTSRYGPSYGGQAASVYHPAYHSPAASFHPAVHSFSGGSTFHARSFGGGSSFHGGGGSHAAPAAHASGGGGGGHAAGGGHAGGHR